MWFDLKIKKMVNTNYSWRHYTDKEKPVEKALASISEIANEIRKRREPRQKSLFGDEERGIGVDEAYKRLEKYIYDPTDYRKLLPDPGSLKELIKNHLASITPVLEKQILNYRDERIRYPGFHLLLDGKPKSDIDILDWLYMVRVYINDEKGENIFWIEKEEVTPCIDLDINYAILPSYRGLVFDKELIDFVRKLFGLEYAPIRSDKEAIEKAVEKYMEFVSRYLPKNWREFSDSKKELKRAIASIKVYCGVLSDVGFDWYRYRIEMPSQELEMMQTRHCRRFASPNDPENWKDDYSYAIANF